MKKKCDIYYIRNFISLIHCACITKQIHNKNYKILYTGHQLILKKIKIYENIIIEDLNKNIDERLLFTFLNNIEQDNKYLIITSTKPIVDYTFELNDLNSRAKNFILSKIDKPEDDLLYALILKNLSDRQISIDKKLIDFIIKRIDRSYGKISEFIYKIDEISLKRKKPIDFKIIKEALGD